MSVKTLFLLDREAGKTKKVSDFSGTIVRIRDGVWTAGVPSWVFGIGDRGFAAFADGYISAIELAQLFVASFFFVSWLFLKPDELTLAEASVPQSYQFNPVFQQLNPLLNAVRDRMMGLRDQHLISQSYILPMPYLCQVYHLLNLKHLESVHGFSLGNLKVVQVSEFQPTEIGGILKFQTLLDSPTNVLRIWRQPIVEVDLILHSPHTVELSIPVYGDRRIIVLFNAFPVSQTEHQFLIDIYSNLGWYKPLLQLVLHCSACLTLLEDLPYLQKLAERNLHRLFQRGKSSHDTMQLFNRFVDLYGRQSEAEPAAIAPHLLALPTGVDESV